jgi:phenol hydroxylase P4 protein
MPVTSIGSYHFPPRDSAMVFGENQLVYFCWERHLLFAAPFILCVPGTMRFADFMDERVKPLLAPDPDVADIDWAKVEWSIGGKPVTIDPQASLIENGIGHKDKIVMATPGLNSLMPDD